MGARGLALQGGDIRLVLRHMDRERRVEGPVEARRMHLAADRPAGNGPGAGIGREGGTARQTEGGRGSAIRASPGEEEGCRIGLEGGRSPRGVGRRERAAAGAAVGAGGIAGTGSPGTAVAGAQMNGEDIRRRCLGELDFRQEERRMEVGQDGLDRRRADTRRGSPGGEGPASTGRSYWAADRTWYGDDDKEENKRRESKRREEEKDEKRQGGAVG